MTTKPLNIILLYRPPNSGYENTDELCSLIDRLEGDTIMIGDFNFPEIDWRNNVTTMRSQSFLDVITANQYQQLVHFPTHTKGNTLDLVLTNCSDRIVNVDEGGRLGRSDHVILYVVVSADTNKSVDKSAKFNWSRADFDGMRAELRVKNWAYNANTDVETDWMEIKNTLLYLTEKYVPQIRPRQNFRPKWLSKDIVKLIRQKKRLWKDVKYLNSGDRLEEYKKLEKLVANKIRNAKRKLERDLAFGDDKSGKKFSMYVKSKTKARTGIGPLKMADGKVTADNKQMADSLNSYFTSVFSKEDVLNLPVKQRETEINLEYFNFDRAEILKVLKNLKQGAAPGPDNISPKLLKELRFEIVASLKNLFQKSLDQTKVPTDWKKATVTPIYKKGSKNNTDLYH
jgi:hypothetical protein